MTASRHFDRRSARRVSLLQCVTSPKQRNGAEPMGRRGIERGIVAARRYGRQPMKSAGSRPINAATSDQIASWLRRRGRGGGGGYDAGAGGMAGGWFLWGSEEGVASLISDSA
jgi:hypothetical protein